MRTAWAWSLGIVTTLFWSSVGILTWPISPRGHLYLRLARIWSRGILGGLGIPLSVEGADRLDPSATVLFMANHRSVFDIFALFVATEHGLRMVAKRSLFLIPIFGWSLWMCGFIPIDRSNRASAIRSLDRAARRIRHGVSVLVFPEGTRSRGAGLLPFKKGGFVLALKAGVPIVPVMVTGTDQIMPPGSLRVGRGEIRVRFGDAIPTAGLDPSDRDRLMTTVRVAMERLEARPLAGQAAPA